MKSWDDKAFCARVVQRCEELGRSQREVLKAAQVAHDYLQTNPTHGRRIDRIAQLAEILDTPLGYLLGLPMEPKAKTEVETEIMSIAYQTAQEVSRVTLDFNELAFVEIQTGVYNLLLARRDEGYDINEPDYLTQIIKTLQAIKAAQKSNSSSSPAS